MLIFGPDRRFLSAAFDTLMLLVLLTDVGDLIVHPRAGLWLIPDLLLAGVAGYYFTAGVIIRRKA